MDSLEEGLSFQLQTEGITSVYSTPPRRLRLSGSLCRAVLNGPLRVFQFLLKLPSSVSCHDCSVLETYYFLMIAVIVIIVTLHLLESTLLAVLLLPTCNNYACF